MFLRLDGTFFVQLVNFAIFFALLNVLFLKPVGRAIAKRREYIKSVTADYDTYQGEANALRANDERLRADARRDAEQIVAKGRADASNATAELASQYGSQVQSVVEEAQRQVASELDAARAASQKTVGDLADMMADRALSEAAR
ncbi:MAG TPA: ATP synthase F0 subunit B [Candidatus Baltobacteraceae bacterium]|jgi:F-type H+-transporting ATPase subunit b